MPYAHRRRNAGSHCSGYRGRAALEALESRLLFSSVVGTFGGATKFSHLLPDGVTKATFSLTAGTGTVSDDGTGNFSISTTGTTISSTLTVSLAGKAKSTTLAGIATDAALGTINCSKVNLSAGVLTVAGDSKKVALGAVTNSALSFNGTSPLTLTMGAVNDTTIVSTQPFTTLSSTSFLSSTPHVSAITAPWISTLSCKPGEFLPDLTLDGAGAPGGVTLKTAKIYGDVFRSTWRITGNVDTLSMLTGFDVGFNGSISGNVKTLAVGNSVDACTLAAANFGSIKIGNGMSIGHILAGASLGADGVFGGGDDTFAAGTIGKFSVGNSVDNRSVVAAGLVSPDDVFPLTGDESLLPGSSIGPISVNNTLQSTCRIVASSLPATAKLHFKPVSTASDPRFHL